MPRKHTPPWVDAIRNRLGSVSDRTLAAEIGRSSSSVAAWRKHLGIVAPCCLPWTDDETETLRHAYGSAKTAEDLDVRALAAQMGRTYASVTIKASKLGLTSYTRQKKRIRKVRVPMFADRADLRASIGKRMKAWIAEHGHPRGALGMKHAPETLAVISEKSKKAWSRPDHPNRTEEALQRMSDNSMRAMMNRPPEKQYSRGKGGRRADLGDVYFRSSWEANYARWLNLLVKQGNILGWTYEPQVFIFHTISRGCRTYTPDFRIELKAGGHEWHEVKGYMDPKSKTRLDRMARHYPEERIVIIDKAWFADANRKGVARLLVGWESTASAAGQGRTRGEW